MLPAQHRMRRSEDFALAVRRGARAGSPLLVAHLLHPDVKVDATPAAPGPVAQKRSALMGQDAEVARIGLVVSKAVGGAVVRTRVKRRLRAQLAARLGRLPTGSLLVVRANAAAAGADSAALGLALDQVLARVLDRVPATPAAVRR
jgi:ribonuclease P protein component